MLRCQPASRHKMGSGQGFLGGVKSVLTLQLHLEDLSKQEVTRLCLQLRGVLAPSTTQFRGIFKIVSAVRSRSNSSGLWFPSARPSRDQPGCWQPPPQQSPWSTRAAIPKEGLPWHCGIRRGAIVSGTMSLSTISRPSQIALGVSCPLLL